MKTTFLLLLVGLSCISLASADLIIHTQPMQISQKINVHSDTAEDLVDMYETLREAAPTQSIRDANDKLRMIVRLKDNNSDLAFKKEIRDGIMNINNKIDEINEELKGFKQKREKKTR